MLKIFSLIIVYFYHGKIYVAYNFPLQLHLVALNTCILLYHHPSPELLILQNWNSIPINNYSPFSPPPQALVHHHSIFCLNKLDCSRDVLCKWSHMIFVLPWLAYFTSHSVLMVHPCCSMYQNFLPFRLNDVPFCINTILFIHSPADGHLGCYGCCE